MNLRASSRYFVASVALLVGVVALDAATAARRSEAELRAQLEERGEALAGVLETSSRNAIRSNALLEEMVARRLTDNARLIDELLAGPLEPGALARVAEQNRLRRIDLLDRDGRPWTPPAPPRTPMMMRGSQGDDAGPPPMMRYMWGRRWARERDRGEDRAPAPIRDSRFWEGSVFGVAIGARSFPGIIVVHADADYVLDFRRAIGVERQIDELARQAGIVAVALLGPDGTALARAGAEPARWRSDDPALARAFERHEGFSRFVADGGVPRFEVARPVGLDGERAGLLVVAFSTEPMERARWQDLRAGGALAVAVLLVGALGLGLIFHTQQRHLRELRELEAGMALRERLAALGDVAAAFAHEVRNPLNAVSMGLQRLRAEFAPEGATEYRRFVDLMQGEVRRLNAIVEQFIGLARPPALKPVAIEVDELLRELVALVEPEARAAGVRVRVAGGRTPPALVADRDHVTQVLLNLVLNAVRAMDAGGALTLGAAATREGAVFTVEDTGPGIPPDVLPRIFDPYFTTRPGGLGLGLTIARRLVEAHGGRIEVDSRPGRGTTFRVVLPERPS